MGGGSYNGKNFGGMHTGADKNANAGPYSNNGYRPEPNVSHLDYEVGDTVTHIGSEKYKHKSRVPNGAKGLIMKKDNMLNKRQKTCRSILKVDFGLYGINYIRKELLQFPSDYSECLEEQLDKMGQNEGIQDYRNEQKTVTKGKLQPAKYKEILENRLKNKEFRDWRKVFLDEKKDELMLQSVQVKTSDEYKNKRTHYNNLKNELEEITALYGGSGDKGLVEVTKECLEKDPKTSKEDILKMFNAKKNKGTRMISLLKNRMRDCEDYFDESSKEYKNLNDRIHDGSRQFVGGVNSKHDYNNYLHHHYGQKGKVEKVDYKYKEMESSREYKVDPETKATESDAINLLQWGLYP